MAHNCAVVTVPREGGMGSRFHMERNGTAFLASSVRKLEPRVAGACVQLTC